MEGTIQYFILWINPIATTLLFFGLSLYIKKPKPALAILLIIDILNTLLLYLNIIFYREFTDFITVKSVLGFSKVSQGLSGSSFSLMKPHDVIYWLDIAVFIGLLFWLKVKKSTYQKQPCQQTDGYRCYLSFRIDFFRKSSVERSQPSTIAAADI